jgi:ribonuclease-3
MDTTGPRHAREFAVSVFLNDEKLGEGRGSSKKTAEEAAARMALNALREKARSTADQPAEPAP